MNRTQTTAHYPWRILLHFQSFPCSFLLLLLFITFGASAQGGIGLKWDTQVGCQAVAGHPNDPDRKYEELIEQGQCLRVCELTSVTYTLTTDDDNSGWENATWTVVGGTATVSVDTFSCIVEWGSAGTGSIAVTVDTSEGTQTVPLLCVEMMQGPTANFNVLSYDVSLLPPIVCSDSDVYFVDHSTTDSSSEPLHYYWDFDEEDANGDPAASTAQNPVYAFNSTGKHIVTLTVRNGCGCESSFTQRINVKKPGVNIECPSVVCEGDHATYRLSSSLSCLSSNLWSVKGGHTISTTGIIGGYTGDYTVVWDDVDDSGFGEISFDGTSCSVACATITTVRIPVIRDHIKIKGEIKACQGEQYLYSLPKWPSTEVSWQINTTTGAYLIATDQPNEIIVQTVKAGTIRLIATYQNTLLNCGGVSEILTINVKSPLNLKIETVICPGSKTYSVPAIAGSTIETINWTLTTPSGDTVSGSGTSFTYDFSVPGNYSLVVNHPSYCRSVPKKIRVLDIPAAPTETLLGKRIVCSNIPENYTTTNTVPGTILGWRVEDAAGTVISTSLIGGSYGEEITAVFPSSFTGPYKLIRWREYIQSPHCRSAETVEEIRNPDLNLTIVPADPEFGIYPCPSSYQTYTIMDSTGQPYTQGETYDWSIDDATLGSVSSENGSPTVTVLWNQFSTEQHGHLKLNIRKCGPVPVFTLDITINKIPEVTIETEAVCNYTPFVPAVSVDAGPLPGVDWYLDGVHADPKLLPEVMFINNSIYGAETHILTGIFSTGEGCMTKQTVSKEILVYELPLGKLSPAFANFCGAITPFTLTLNPQQPGTTIKWFNEGVEITSAYNSTSYLVTDFGFYYCELSNAHCTNNTPIVFVTNDCAEPPCEIEGPHSFALAAVPDVCGKIKATVTNILPDHEWNVQGEEYGNTAFSNTETGNDALFEFNVPDRYKITYTGNYPAVGGGTCAARKTVYAIVPYIAQIDSKIECNGTGGYDVTLLDASPSYIYTPVTVREFFIDGISQGTQAGYDFSAAFAPGSTHVVKVIVSTPGYAACASGEMSITLPGIPDAAFTFTSNICNTSCGEVCSNKSIHLTVTSPHAGETYEWSFGDGSSNRQQNPDKVYALNEHQFYTVTLTVTNQFGCVAVQSQIIEVLKNDLIGSIDVTPDTNCEGFDTLLSYSDSGLSTATHFVWMNGYTTVPGSTDTATFSVTKSGAYWVKTRDALGCTSETPTKTATFVMIPDAAILGPDAVCVGKTFTLSAYAGGTTTTYGWEGPSGPFSTNPNLNVRNDAAGTYVYAVIIRIPKPGGGYCETELHKTVVVYDPPQAPIVEVSEILCNPFRVVLHATSGTLGTFNWSDGQATDNDYESFVTVTDGGAYEVAFMNPAGCVEKAQINVPKDPETFLWLFPSGCYENCDKAGAVIMGPIAEFTHWEWQSDGSSLLSGDGSAVDNYDLQGNPGNYALLLQNGDCAETSRPLSISFDDCPACDEVSDISLDEIVAVEDDGFCHYTVTITLVFAAPLLYDSAYITVDNSLGIITPSLLAIVPGTNTFTFDVIPFDNFSGGNFNIRITGYSENGRCDNFIPAHFPALCQDGEVTGRAAGSDTAQPVTASLLIAPNPSHSRTEISYSYAGANADMLISVYDLTGRLLATHKPETAKGSWSFDTDSLAAGQYMVVMRENGRIIRQQNLVIN